MSLNCTLPTPCAWIQEVFTYWSTSHKYCKTKHTIKDNELWFILASCIGWHTKETKQAYILLFLVKRKRERVIPYSVSCGCFNGFIITTTGTTFCFFQSTPWNITIPLFIRLCLTVILVVVCKAFFHQNIFFFTIFTCSWDIPFSYIWLWLLKSRNTWVYEYKNIHKNCFIQACSVP